MRSAPARRAAVICTDDDARAALLAWALTSCAFSSVHITQSYGAFLEVARTECADAALIDLALAGAQGVKVVSSVHAVAPATRVVLLSSFSSVRKAAMAHGAFDLIDPSDIAALQTSLRRMSSIPQGLKVAGSVATNRPPS